MNKSLSKGAIYLAISSLALMLAGYIVNIYLGRVLGPVNYGMYGIVISLMTAANLMQTAGLPQAVSKFVAEDENEAENILKSSFVIQLISTILLTLIFFLLADSFAVLLHDVNLASYIRLASLIFPFYGIFSLYTGLYNGMHNFSKQSLLNIFYSVAKIFSILFLVYLFGLYGAIVGFIISPLFALFYGFHLPKISIVSYSYRKLIFFALPLVGFAIFSNLLQSIDLFFVKALMHMDKYTGFYTANQNIAEIPFFAVTALAGVLFPSISKRVKQKLELETKNLIKKSLRFSTLILLPSIFLISSTSIQIITFFYSTKYIEGAESLSILAFGNGFLTLFFLLAIIISGSGFPFRSSFLAACGVFFSIVLCILLIPKYGLNGAAIATTISAFIVMVSAGVIVYRKFGVLVPVKSTLKIVIASFIVYILSRVVVVSSLLLPLLYIVLFGVYLIILILFKEITDDDLTIVKGLMPTGILNKIKK